MRHDHDHHQEHELEHRGVPLPAPHELAPARGSLELDQGLVMELGLLETLNVLRAHAEDKAMPPAITRLTLSATAAGPYRGNPVEWQGFRARTLFVYNNNAFAVYIGQGAGAGALSTALAVVPAYTAAVLPIEEETYSIGCASSSVASADASITVARYREALAPAVFPLGTINALGPGPLAAGSSAGSFPIDHPYAKGKTHDAVSIAPSASSGVDLVTAGYRWLTLLCRMTASSGGKITLLMRPYEDDGTTVFSEGPQDVIPATRASADYFAGGVDKLVKVFELGGIDKVQVIVSNGDLSSQTATCVYYLQK